MDTKTVGLLALLLTTLSAGIPPSTAQGLLGRTLPTRHEAAVVVEHGRAGPRDGDVVRCARGQRVGVWMAPGQGLDMRDLTIDGCEVGIVLDGSGDGPSGAEGVVSASASVDAVVSGVTISGCLVGIWAQGYGGRVFGGTIHGCQYGVVVSGDRYTIEYNTILNATKDGILVTGTGNILRGNRIDRAGVNGINIVGSLPIIAPGVYVQTLRELARQNTIVGNVIVNGIGSATGQGYDLRQWPISCPSTGNLYNANVFTTKSAYCLR